MGKSIRDNHKGEEPRWIKCIVCGAEAFAYATDIEEKCFICKSCRDSIRFAKIKNVEEPQESPTEDIVSMRCRRHKKRFNVPRSWVETDQWLCPHCHYSLDEESRKRYYPSVDLKADIREAESDKPIKWPSLASAKMAESQKKRAFEKPKGSGEAAIAESPIEPSINPSSETLADTPSEAAKAPEAAETHIGQEQVSVPPTRRKRGVSKGTKRGSYQKHEVHPVSNPDLKALLPRYEIKCKKCNETVRCHYSWFDTSLVLCPECYSKMTETEIEKFHMEHKGVKPRPKSDEEIERERFPIPLVEPHWFNSVSMKVLNKKNIARINASNIGAWSNDRITRATIEEIQEGVRTGSLSRIRAKIELRRRKDKELYEMFAPPESIGGDGCRWS